ncbi:MAG: PTS sugar transporter subunit IIC [Saccharofermentanales bacterium]|jgi:PTS system ascorbate-specific IIC component
MDKVINFLVNDLLTTPTIVIGLLIMLGYILQKESAVKVITGTVSAMVGMQLIVFGGGQFSNLFKPITEAVAAKTGVQGYLMDSYAMRTASLEALGDKAGWMGYVFLIAFAVNILLVYFGKYTKARGVFLTGNAGTAHSQGMLWLMVANFALSSPVLIIASGVIVGIYWAYSTTLAAKVVDEVTEGGGFTVGHNQQVGIWFFGRLAEKMAPKKKDKKILDCDHLELPGWLAIFNNNVVSIAILMTIFVGLFCIPLGFEGLQELAGKKHWSIFLILLGIQFSMFMVILLQGVRMLCSELTASFQGIQQKIVPNAVPAIDVAALLPFSPNATTFGFLFCTLGTVISMLILSATGSPIMVLPGFTPLFFSGGPIGVVANKKGGLKAVIICCTLLGVIQTFGTVWAITQMNYPEGMGWSGMFDLSTVWPALIQVLRWIGSVFGFTIAY